MRPPLLPSRDTDRPRALPMTRMVVELQFCSWSACRMNRISSARAITGLATYLGSVMRQSMFMKFSRVAEIVVGIDVRMAAAMAIGISRKRRHLGDQANDLALPDFTVANVPRLRDRR